MREFSGSKTLAVVALALLSALGVAYIFSTGYLGSQYPVRPNWLRQCAFLALGAVAAVGMSRLDHRGTLWRVVVWGGYAAGVVLLAVVLVAGKEIGGARRWLRAGPLLLQPAEFAKTFTLLAGAWLAAGMSGWKRRYDFLALLGCFLLPMGLMLLEPSYGNAGSLAPCLAVLVGICFFPRWLWNLCAVLAVAVLFAVAVGVNYLRNQPPPPDVTAAAGPAESGFLHGYHLKRLHAFLSPEGDWNEQQSLMTVAGGGWFGKGYLNGTMKKLGFLPRTVAPTDFIFAVIAEEGGLVFGVLPVLALYMLLFALLLHRAGHAADRQELAIVCAGCTLLFVHVLVGVGMSIRLVPVIGLPLPLLSYGGSFTLATMMLMGAMLGIRTQAEEGEDAPEPAVANGLTLRLGPFFRLKITNKDG